MEACLCHQDFCMCVCVWKAGMVSIHGARPHYTDVSQLFFFCVEKPSTAHWTRALLLKRRCQHTTTRCWARTTRKTTSLSAKQVQSAAAFFLLRFCYFSDIRLPPPLKTSHPLHVWKGALIFPFSLHQQLKWLTGFQSQAHEPAVSHQRIKKSP